MTPAVRPPILLFSAILSAFCAICVAADQAPPRQKPADAVAPAAPDAAPSENANLLGKVNTSSGEGRRNENVQFNQIDNNALRDLQKRLGTTATAVEEFKADRNYYGAEYGNSAPGQIHLTPLKSTASWHGALSETHGNSVFSARSFFQFGPVKPAHSNQFGFQLGGGLWKGSFLSLEASEDQNRGFVNGNILVPLPAERTILARDPAVIRLLQKWIDAYPLAVPNRPDIDPRALNTNAPQSIGTYTTGETFDQQLSKRDRVIVRHTLVLQKVDAFAFVKGQNPNTTTRASDARLTWQRTLNAATEFSASTGFDRNHTLIVPKADSVGPSVSIGTAWTALGPASILPIDRIQNRFRYSAEATHRRGRHTLTAGLEIARLQVNGRETSSNRGTFAFRSNFGNDAITNFRLGLPDRASNGTGDNNRGYRYLRQQYFVGDSWKLSNQLTLTWGLQYLPANPPVEVNNRTAFDVACDCNNFSPRLGIAWHPRDGWGIVRVNYGLVYGEIFAPTYQQLRWDPPQFIKAEVQVPDLLNPYGNIYLGPGARATIYRLPRNLVTPYSQQYNLQWEFNLPSGSKLQLSYEGSRTWKLFFLDFTNRALPVGALTSANVNDRRPDPTHYDIRVARNMARGYFDSARVTWTLMDHHGLSGDASYWFSKALDTGAAYTNTAAGDDAVQGYSQSEFLISKDLKGPSAFDQPHALLVRVNYAIPAPAGGWWTQAIARWTTSAIFLAKTGSPFSVIAGSDGPGFGNVDGVNGDRPNILDPSILGRAIGNPDTSVALLPKSAFSFIRPGELRGTLGAGTFRKGGIRNMNANLTRAWNLRGSGSVAFRAEAINLLNTPQFAEPASDLTSPAFGKITNTLNDGRTFRLTLRLGF